MDQLFEEAKGLNPLLPEQALRAAADFIGKEPTGSHRADAVRCVELAGVIARYKGESVGDESEAIPLAASRDSSTTSFLRQGYLRAIEPAVRRVRNHYFGQETAPFPDDNAAASEWFGSISKKMMEEVLALEHPALIKYLTHVMGEKKAAESESLGFENLDSWTRSPLYEFVELTIEASRATGFQQLDVVKYVLCGEEPRVVRVVGQSRRISVRVDDSRVDRAEVTLTIQSPDLSKTDLQEIRTFVRKAWIPPDGGPPLRFEDEDEILRRLLIELGDDGSRRRHGFWPDLLSRWKEEVEDADATVGQLKMREQRLQKKLRQLNMREATP